MKCPQCGNELVCAACHAAIDAVAKADVVMLEEMAAGRTTRAGPSADQSQTFLVVAKGHQDLLQQLQGVVGEFGWVRVIEDRRDDSTLLPRAGREGSVHVEGEIEP